MPAFQFDLAIKFTVTVDNAAQALAFANDHAELIVSEGPWRPWISDFQSTLTPAVEQAMRLTLKALDPSKYAANETPAQVMARVAEDQRRYGVAEGERDMRPETAVSEHWSMDDEADALCNLFDTVEQAIARGMRLPEEIVTAHALIATIRARPSF